MSETVTIEARAAHTAEIRARAASEMAGLGIDRELIDRLVETFYDRIRAHDTLGPVFEAKLAGQWVPHLAKMKRFWGSLAFKDGAYGGKPVAAHQGLSGMTAGLFPQWLTLFGETLVDVVPNAAAQDWFMATATRIARSLTLSLFYDPSQDDPTRARP